MTSDGNSDRRLYPLMLGALGVVYGDIGTSPLYAIRECFTTEHGVAASRENVLGVLSMVVWTLVLVVCIKYVTFVLRADNRGEGGILALLALAFGDAKAQSRRRALLMALGVFGAALLYGDGLITPCITVLGAVEGLELSTSFFTPYIVPISIVILIGLFWLQQAGTGKVGAMFGPVMLVWFGTLAVLGIRGILMSPGVLQALFPWHALTFFAHNGTSAILVVGTMFLAVTGAEALYADLGHFGRRPIQWAWFTIAFPALLLNYLGQGGLLLANPTTAENPFFLLAPGWALIPLVVLSTAASVIASQALITGTYSITMQAIQLGYLPRLEIRHTSSEERGQIYMPYVNWLLMIGCIGLCLGFRSSSALASAYGIAVTLTMLVTTVLFYFATQRVFGWPAIRAGMLCGSFAVMELIFFGANAAKIAHGGWFPLLVALLLFTVMYTWKTGRRHLYERHTSKMIPLADFIKVLQNDPPIRVPGTAIYMAGSASGTPLAMLHNLKHNKVMHERVVMLTVMVAEEPHVPPEQRLSYEALPNGFHRVIAQYGFMEQPRVLELLKQFHGYLEFRISDTTFFLSRETIVAAKKRRMPAWRAWLFAYLLRNAQPATAFFGLPANRVVELGVQIEF